MLNITDVRVSLEQRQGSKCKAHATFILDDGLLISGFRLVEGESGLFLATPDKAISYRCSHCGKDTQLSHRYCSHCGNHTPWEHRPWEYLPSGAPKKFFAVAHPLTREVRELLFDLVYQEYQKLLAETTEQPYEENPPSQEE